MVKNDKIDNITVCGGSLCIDFLNTVKDRVSEPPEDYLSSFNDLLYWAKRMEIISAKQYLLQEVKAAKEKEAASLFFKESIAYREVLFKLFSALTKEKRVSAAVMEICNSQFATCLPYIKLVQQNEVFEKAWNYEDENFEIITTAISYDCFELLLAGNFQRLKECPKCGWIFVDSTKNGKRKWCSMKTCGSGVKALEWYHRQKRK